MICTNSCFAKVVEEHGMIVIASKGCPVSVIDVEPDTIPLFTFILMPLFCILAS